MRNKSNNVEQPFIQTFRKRPVEIQAVQLTPENGALVWKWADSKPFYEPDGQISGLSIYTLEGRMKANFGDWIVRGVQGEFYPVKPEIFAETYEPAQNDTRPSHDLRACDAETLSWNHFSPEAVDHYWITCDLRGPHDEHEDSHTGLTWRDQPTRDTATSHDQGGES